MCEIGRASGWSNHASLITQSLYSTLCECVCICMFVWCPNRRMLCVWGRFYSLVFPFIIDGHVVNAFSAISCSLSVPPQMVWAIARGNNDRLLAIGTRLVVYLSTMGVQLICIWNASAATPQSIEVPNSQYTLFEYVQHTNTQTIVTLVPIECCARSTTTHTHGSATIRHVMHNDHRTTPYSCRLLQSQRVC